MYIKHTAFILNKFRNTSCISLKTFVDIYGMQYSKAISRRFSAVFIINFISTLQCIKSL